MTYYSVTAMSPERVFGALKTDLATIGSEGALRRLGIDPDL